MKPLLYIGAALMFGAGIYGFVDYKSHSKELQSLYRKEQKKEVKEPIPARVDPAGAISAAVATEKKETVVVDKKKVAVRKQVVKKKHKKLSRKQFSRAPLVEEVEVEIPLPEPAKKAGQ